MGLFNWFDKADALEVTHKGAAVHSHPDNIAADETKWEEEAAEDEVGRKAHAAINELFAALDEDEE
jgi:hypothetical protein